MTQPTSAAEQCMRTRGRWMILVGISIAVLTVILAVVWYYGFDDDMPLGLVLPLYGAGFGAISLGCIEFISRPSRANHELALARMNQIENGLQQLVELLPEEMQQRWYTGYARGTQDGPALRTGTDYGVRGVVTTGDVLKLQRRNSPTR